MTYSIKNTIFILLLILISILVDEKTAEEKAKAIVDKSEILKEAEAKANEVIANAHKKSKEMIKVANEYVDDLMTRADNELSKNLAEIRRARKSLKDVQK